MHDFEQVPERRDGYLPLEDFGVLSEGHSLVVAGGDGSIDWRVPNLNLDPLFDRLLKAGVAGRFVVGLLPWAELARRVDGIEGAVGFRVEVRLTRRVQPRIER